MLSLGRDGWLCVLEKKPCRDPALKIFYKCFKGRKKPELAPVLTRNAKPFYDNWSGPQVMEARQHAAST